MRRISWLAKKRLASQEELCSKKKEKYLFIYLLIYAYSFIRPISIESITIYC
jgi:hypothetical protein